MATPCKHMDMELELELDQEGDSSEAAAAASGGRTYVYNDKEVYAEDGIQLVKRFSAKGSTQYRQFQEEWEESKFYYIHCLGKDDGNKNLITEVICSAMTDMVVDEDKPMIERIGAVYVWYAMYHTQITVAPVSIRLSQSDWAVLSSLQHGQLKDTQACYIIDKLHSVYAFHLCYSRHRLYPGLHREAAARDTVNTVKRQLLKEESPLIQSLRGVEQLQLQYTDMKESLKEHLPPHLLESFGFGNLLTQERIKKIAHPPTDEIEEEDIASLAPVASNRTRKRRRRNIIQDAYTSSPSTSWRGV